MEMQNIRDTYLTQAARTYQIWLDVAKRLACANKEVDELRNRKEQLENEYDCLGTLLQRYDITLDELQLRKEGSPGWCGSDRVSRALLPAKTSTEDCTDAERKTTLKTGDAVKFLDRKERLVVIEVLATGWVRCEDQAYRIDDYPAECLTKY